MIQNNLLRCNVAIPTLHSKKNALLHCLKSKIQQIISKEIVFDHELMSMTKENDFIFLLFLIMDLQIIHIFYDLTDF